MCCCLLLISLISYECIVFGSLGIVYLCLILPKLIAFLSVVTFYCSAVVYVAVFCEYLLMNATLIVAIGNAFSVLSCPEKRQRYDRYGTEEEQVPVMSRRHFYHNNGNYEYDFTRGFEGE